MVAPLSGVPSAEITVPVTVLLCAITYVPQNNSSSKQYILRFINKSNLFKQKLVLSQALIAKKRSITA
jgi:hypothetical protein